MFFQKNIEALEEKNPALAALVKSAFLTGRYKLVASQPKDKAPSLLDLKINANYYDSVDPIAAAQADLEKRGIRLPNLAIFLGMGAGYHALNYLRLHPYAYVLIIEEDPELLKVVFSGVLLTDLLLRPNVTLLGGPDLRALYPALFNFFNNSNNLVYLKALNIIELPAALTAYKEYYIGSVRLIKEAIAQVITLYGNDPYDSLLGIKMTLRNISVIINNPGIKELEGVFKGMPGIVAATGPSLNKNADLLRGLRNKAVIAAADATVKVLLSRGLPPAHLVTSLERVISTSKLFEGLSAADTEGSFLSACPVVVPETYANWPGDKIIVYRNFATFEWLDIPKGTLDIGPSSANMAFKILEFLGCDPIILIGQDLAYDEDMKSHAEGFHYGSDFETKYVANAVYVEGNYSPSVPTSRVWQQFLLHYERDIANYKGKVINSTEGGAKIHGTELMTFAEAIEKYIAPIKEKDIWETIKENLRNSSSGEKKAQTKTVLEKLYYAKNFCQKIIAECRKGTELCFKFDKLYERTAGKPSPEDMEKIRKITRKLAEIQTVFNEKDFYLILMHYVQSFYIKSVMDINAIKASADESSELYNTLISKSKEMFSVMGALVDKLVVEFDASAELLEKFREELENEE